MLHTNPQDNALVPNARRILEAARVCFERYGFHAASMARIAAEASISVGHIYRYFADKEAVIAAIVADDLAQITRDIDGWGGDAEEIADLMIAHMLSRREPGRMALWLEVMAEGARNPKIAAMIEDAEAHVRARLSEALSQACQARGEVCALGEAEAQLRLSTLALVLDGLQIRLFQERKRLTPGLLDEVRRLLIDMLSPPPSGAGTFYEKSSASVQ